MYIYYVYRCNRHDFLKANNYIYIFIEINLGKFIEYKARLINQPKLVFSNFTIETNQGRFRTYDPLIKKYIT